MCINDHFYHILDDAFRYKTVILQTLKGVEKSEILSLL